MEKETIFPTAVKMMIFSVILGGILVIFTILIEYFLLKPKRVKSNLEKQGIRGPKPSILFGNIAEINSIIQFQKPLVKKSVAGEEEKIKNHNWVYTVFPHLVNWRNEYGSTFLYSTGSIQILCITNPDIVKELSLFTSLDLGKPSYLSTERGPLLGRGILTSNRTYWAYQRKIIAPEFYQNKVKGVVDLMVESTLTMLKNWESKIENSGGKIEIRADEDLINLSADIISRVCFGSSYAKGETIFSKLQALKRVMAKGSIGIPGLRYIPNGHNRAVWKLEREIDSMILDVVKNRKDDSHKKDLLQSILNAAAENKGDEKIPKGISLNKFIVDNCKNIYFAGHETTANSASWCFVTMAAYPEWQSRAREEVMEICGKEVPTADMLRNMKTLTMVIHETLRLYPPVAYVVREALEEINFKEIRIPKGVNVQIPIPLVHQDRDLWGPDVYEFKPDRFANGISGACKAPHAYMPFGVGPRTCAGQNFAMTELKVILSLVLSKFRFSLAPSYRHLPVFRLVIQPENGVTIYLEKM